MNIDSVFNASHRLSNQSYYEWWYFQFVTQNYTLNMVVHETDIFGLNKAPYISLSLISIGNAPIYYRRLLKTDEIRRHQPFLEIGNGLIYESSTKLFINIDFPQTHPNTHRLVFRTEMTKLAPALQFSDCILYTDNLSARSSYWLVQIPYGIFEGTIEIGGEIIQINGTAYHDHQWGILPLQEYVSDWVWGQFSNESEAMIFFKIITQTGDTIIRSAIINNGYVNMDEDLLGSQLESLISTLNLPNASMKVDMSFINSQSNLSFSIKPSKLMRSRIDEHYGGFMFSYLRWATKAIAYNDKRRRSMKGITEYMRIKH